MIIVRRQDEVISIHAPREGSDRVTFDKGKAIHISIHAPREGSDPVLHDVRTTGI